MAELPPVVPGEPIDSTDFGNPVIDRVISRYADATERTAKVAAPQPGDPSYLLDSGSFAVYNGTVWASVHEVERVLALDGTNPLPAYGFASKENYGMYLADGGTALGFSVNSALTVKIAPSVLSGPRINDAEPLIRIAGTPNTPTSPAYTFNGATTTGYYIDASGNSQWSQAGVRRMALATTHSFYSDINGYLRYRIGADGGSYLARWYGDDASETIRVELRNDRLYVKGATEFVAEPTASGGSASVSWNNVGGSAFALRHTSSARRHKHDIQDAGHFLKDLLLVPVTFTHDDGEDYIGFVADDLAAQDQRIGEFNLEGEILRYDSRAVIAVLAAKVNDLEDRLATLEAK